MAKLPRNIQFQPPDKPKPIRFGAKSRPIHFDAPEGFGQSAPMFPCTFTVVYNDSTPTDVVTFDGDDFIFVASDKGATFNLYLATSNTSYWRLYRYGTGFGNVGKLEQGEFSHSGWIPYPGHAKVDSVNVSPA